MSNQDQCQGLLRHFNQRFYMFFAFTRPGRQVSVYRTISPPV